MANTSLTIFGAGLIGGSIALAARRAHRYGSIVAIDKNEPAGGDLWPFDEWISSEDAAAIPAALAHSSLTVLCTPVGSIISSLPRILDGTTGWVTDCGSTKQAILECVRQHPARSRFVAGHPMAGHPQGGIANARPDLFDDRRWILCTEGSDASAAREVAAFVSSLGAHVVVLSAAQHDKSVAHTSHLPQVVASALSVQAATEDALQAAGPGFASATRVAGGAESMWRDIFETNGAAIGQALGKLGHTLLRLSDDLERDDLQTTLDVLAHARELRDDS